MVYGPEAVWRGYFEVLVGFEHFLGHISTSQKLTKKAKYVLAIKNLFQNLKKSTFKL